MGYANGQAPASALVNVDGVLMVPTIAPRVRALMAAAARAGVTIRPHRLGGYRDLAAQRVEWERGASGGSTVRPAYPGSSTHGDYQKGRVDLVGRDGYTYTSADLSWMVANAGRFGLVREFGAADPNHFMESGAFAGVVEDWGMELTDKITVRDPANWAVVKGQATLADYFMGSNYREQRAEIQLNDLTSKQVPAILAALSKPSPVQVDTQVLAKAVAAELAPMVAAAVAEEIAKRLGNG